MAIGTDCRFWSKRPLASTLLWFLMIGTGVITVTLSCSEKSTRKGSIVSERIEVRAVILDYTPNAMQDSFDHGGFASYDASKLRILTPEEWAGLELNIYHGGETPRESLWRAVGQRIVFDIARDNLMGEMTLFDGAVSRLRADCSNDSKGQ